MIRSTGSDPRMVSGPVISNVIFFAVSDLQQLDDASGRALGGQLQSLTTQEVWLESSGESLDRLQGRLEVVTEGGATPCSSLRREGDGYRVRLVLSVDDYSRLHIDVPPGGSAELRLLFDVEYREGFESPGGYSSAHGVRYWDDVAYPHVRVDGFEFSSLSAR